MTLPGDSSSPRRELQNADAGPFPALQQGFPDMAGTLLKPEPGLAAPAEAQGTAQSFNGWSRSPAQDSVQGASEWTQGRKNVRPFNPHEYPRDSLALGVIKALLLRVSPSPSLPWLACGEEGAPFWLPPSFIPGLLPGPRGCWAQSQS